MVVTVHAEEPDGLAVDLELPVGDLDRAETDELGVDLGEIPIGVDQLDEHPVPGRRLGRPRLDVGQIESCVDVVPAEEVRRGERVGHGVRDRLREALLAQGLDRGADLPSRTRRGGTADGRAHGQAATAGEVVVRGVTVDRRDTGGGASFDPDLAVQTTHPPLILILDVAVGTPLDDDDRDFVSPDDDMVGDVVLARESAVGSVAGELAVDVQRVHALGAADVQHDASAEPALGDGDLTSVHAGRVAVGEVRRRPVEGHLHVGVLRQVGVTVLVDRVLHGPVARDGDLRPAAAVSGGGDRRRRDVVGVVEQPELPAAVERFPPRRWCGVVRVGGAGIADRRVGRRRRCHRHPTDRGDRRIGPRSYSADDGKHPPIVPGRHRPPRAICEPSTQIPRSTPHKSRRRLNGTAPIQVS